MFESGLWRVANPQPMGFTPDGIDMRTGGAMKYPSMLQGDWEDSKLDRENYIYMDSDMIRDAARRLGSNI